MHAMQIKSRKWSYAAAFTLASAFGLTGGACAGDDGSGAGTATGSGGASTPVGSGGSGGVNPAAGSGGAIGRGGAGTAGSGGAATLGSGGAAKGGSGGAATLGSGGAATLGSGGTIGGGGAGGSIMRGADPTEQTASMPGPYRVARYSTGLAESPAYADYDVDYPADAPPPLAGVAVIPGFIEGRSAVGDWGPFLASHGFAVITIDPNSNLDVPTTRADALWAAIGSLKDENQRAGSPLMGKVDTRRFAVMGHSMGGGGTLEAANAHSADLRAAIPLAPWDLLATFGMITVPTMILAGQSDTVAPVAQHAMPFYSSIPATTVKAYVEFTGGDHYVADSPVTNKGAAVLGLSWLKVYVEGDIRYRPLIKSRPELSSYLAAP